MKAIWKGAIGFGLVNIPIKLYSAVESSSLDLDMVDRRDMGKIHFRRVNENTGKEVKWEDIGKAFLVNDEYVLLEEADFEQAAPEKSKVIEVNNFVNQEEINPIYYESSYYIAPEKAGLRAYVLLREALYKSGKVGVAQFVLRTAETLAVIKPMGDLLVLTKIRFAEEIRDPEGVEIPESAKVKPTELQMALSLIDQYSTEFDIASFKNEYVAALKEVIREKAKGHKRSRPKMRVVHSKSQDLMEQLKASLSKKKAS